MAIFPLQIFTQGEAQVGLDERYRSSPLGIRFAGQPKGAYVGFVPSVLGSVLTLAIDPTFGYSLVKVGSDADPSGMDVIITSDVSLDFAGQPAFDFPMNVMVRVQYYADGSTPTSAEIFSRSDTIPVSDTEALLCVVDGPAASLTVASDVSLQQRDEPLAYGHVNFGFMPGGSIEDLQAAADIVDEVIAARLGLDNTAHTDLSTRIAEDYGAELMASRLALIFRALRSNDYSVDAGQQEIIVSGSFSEVDRDFRPDVTLDGDGSESSEGALASPNDTIRNVAVIVDADTGYRPVDNPTDRRIVFGRIVGPNEAEISGAWRFLNASPNVATTDGNGQATIEIEEGVTITGPDGKHYEVETIVNNNSIVLRTPYQGATAPSTTTTIRRWVLQLRSVNAGNEGPASLPDAATVRFFFPTFVSTERSNADWRLAMHTAAERKPLAAASTSVPGLVRLADTGALLGSVNIQSMGAPLGGGPYHTVNFNAANASVVPVPGSPGAVQVAEIGPQGLQGPDGASGGPGNPGAPGPGFSQLNPFQTGPEITFPGTNPPMPFSFTADVGHTIRYVHGNIARFRDFGNFAGGGADRLVITDVGIVGPGPTTMGRIDGTLAGDNALLLFLSTAGD